MKKNDLLKTIGICFLVFIVLSFIVPTGSFATGEYVKGDFASVGITDLFYYPVITFGTFIQYGLLFLCIGGFYGVMNETGVYKKMVDAFTKKFKNKEKRFLVFTILVLAVISALTNLHFALFLLVPLLVAVIMSLGYNKLTALASTVGAILVGSIGTLYGINNAHVNSLLSLDVNNNIVAKIVLFAVLVFLFIMFVVKKSDLKQNKKEEKVEIPLLDTTKTSKKSFLPLAISLGLLTIILFVSMYSWNYNLSIAYFDELYESIMNVTIKDYPIFAQLIGDVSPFGYWDTYEMCGVLLAGSLLLGWIYSIKFSNVIKSFAEGSKKMLKVAFFVTLSNLIFTLMIAASDSNILNTINHHLLSMSENFNIVIATLVSIVGPLFYNNFYYLSNMTLPAVTAVYTDVSVYGTIGILFQGIYSLMMLIIPTSMVLVAGLSMLDISLKDWFKYIWKYLIWTFIIILIVAILLFMLI